MGRPVGHPDNKVIGTIAAETSWANTKDPAARTAPARKAAEQRFIDEARKRYGDLSEEELARRAEHLRRAYFAKLALKSVQARRKRVHAHVEGDAA